MLNSFQHPPRRRSNRRGQCDGGAVMFKQPCAYILASRPRGTIYIGVTAGLITRIYQHRSGEIPGFTSRYAVYRLVRYEFFESMAQAIAREKQLKRWHRQWKINLIESENLHWADLAVGLGLEPLPQIGTHGGC
jgi:putative endonuclease